MAQLPGITETDLQRARYIVRVSRDNQPANATEGAPATPGLQTKSAPAPDPSASPAVTSMLKPSVARDEEGTQVVAAEGAARRRRRRDLYRGEMGSTRAVAPDLSNTR